MAYINTAAGNEAVLKLYQLSAGDVIDTSNVITVPYMQDITINNSTGTFRFKTLASGSESVVTTPATNQLSLNAIVDDVAFFGNASATAGTIQNEGILGTSTNKTKIGFHAYFSDPEVAGSHYFEGVGYISGLSPTVNPDSPLWITPVTIEVDGDYTKDVTV